VLARLLRCLLLRSNNARRTPPEGESMAGKSDKVKGRVKKAAGALANDKSLEREGKIQHAAGTVKDALEGAVDAVKNALTGHKK
jgi:uncharacterized protein YjbJ (UPF0337 family)